MEKNDLKKIKGLLYGVGLGVMSLNLSGCSKPAASEDVVGYSEDNNYKQENVGFFKVSGQVIPYYKYDQHYWFIKKGYYSYENGEFICDEDFCLDGSILYSALQVIPFRACNPDVEYNYETISSFTENTYRNLEESYFDKCLFSSESFKVYEILNLNTNKATYIIGRKVSGTQVFNFETYKVEDYTGFAIKEMEGSFDKESYSYQEILDFIENYRKENKGLSLERK